MAAFSARSRSDAKYAVYLRRQQDDIAAVQRDEAAILDPDLDFSRIAGLSNEAEAAPRAGPPGDARPGRADRGHDAGGACHPAGGDQARTARSWRGRRE